ncbi:zinc finger protein 177-like [Rhagoletis pomonella]|uniref:zinc finger protein 177-like n=1 Tax=Rhagoletis pomonella TaxID=28610 RepID=UPI00177B0097|nr:zinc finger protein 177-like [Rhagoletis pomonella]
MAAATVQRFHCGEVFITTNFSMILECKSCNEQFGVYTTFLDHIFEKHFDDWNASEKSKRQKPKKVATITEQEIPKLSTDDQYVEIDSTTLKEFMPESEEDDFITEVLAPMDDDAVVVEANEIEGQPTPKTTKPAVRQVGTSVTRKDSTASGSEQKYKCRICGFAVSGAHNLRGHEQRHTNVKPFTCLKCDKAFYTRTELNTHTRRHNGDKPFVCAYCGKSFITAGMLTMHEKRHLGQRQHKCNQCEKSFYEAFHLRNHAVVHSQERNYECETCQAKFSRKITLQTHMKLHENALRYECVICHMRFNQRPTMLWHVKSKHNVLRADADNKGPAKGSNPIGDAYE